MGSAPTVLLIYPPQPASDDSIECVSPSYPLGAIYVAASLWSAGIRVSVFDAFVHGFYPAKLCDPIAGSTHTGIFMSGPSAGEDYPANTIAIGAHLSESVLRQFAPADVVGISVPFTSSHYLALRLASGVRRAFPNAIIVMGGPHVTVAPEDVLAYPDVDYIILGEGEVAMVALVEALAAGRSPAGLPGVGWRDGNGMPMVNDFELIPDLDALAFPAFFSLTMSLYEMAMAGDRVIKMYTSRGCTFDCSFCSVPLLGRRRWRAHSPERVLDEMDMLVDIYNTKGIMFEDDNMTLNSARCKVIFEEVIRRGYGLRLMARNFRADTLDAELLALMRRAGFEEVWIAPESGNERVMSEEIGKRMTPGESEAAVRRILNAGLRPAIALVIGMPDETRSELEETVAFAKQLKGMGAGPFWISLARPLPGTRLWQRVLDKGLIDGRLPTVTAYNTPAFSAAGLSMPELAAFRKRMMAELND